MLNGFERTIGQRILKLRSEKKLSQTALAIAAGLSRKAVNTVESGNNHRMEVRTLLLLARALSVTPNDLCAARRYRQTKKKGLERTPVHKTVPVKRI